MSEATYAETLEIVLAQIQEQRDHLVKQNIALELRAERAEKWIKDHGKHGDYCEPILPNPEDKSTCTCGMDAILKGLQ